MDPCRTLVQSIAGLSKETVRDRDNGTEGQRDSIGVEHLPCM